MKKYNLTDPSKRVALYEGDDPREICKILSERRGSESLALDVTLPISFTARVLGKVSGSQIVVFEGEGFKKELPRKTPDGGIIGVSCDPNGVDVPADSINIEFKSPRSIELTDRSILWAMPGYPAKAEMTFHLTDGATEEMFFEILTAAEKALDEQLLVHLASGAAA